MESRTPQRSLPWGLFLIACLLILSRNPIWFADQVRLVPPLSQCVLTPDDAWQVPAVEAGLVDLLAAVPYWLYAILSATVITVVATTLAVNSSCIALFAVLGLSMMSDPLHVVPGACLVLGWWLMNSLSLRHRASIQFALLCCLALGTVFLTLEFGLILAVLLVQTLLVLLKGREGAGHLKFFLVMTGVTIGGFVLSLSGFRPTLLRPLTWVTVPVELISRLQTPMQTWSGGIAVAVTGIAVALFVYAAFQQTERMPKGRLLLTLTALCLLWGLVITCEYYFFLGAIALCLLVRELVAAPIEAFSRPALRIISLAGIVVLLGLQTDKVAILAGQVPQQNVVPQNWVRGGRVILLDLDRAPLWQTQQQSQRFSLIVDDRWDLYRKSYREYLSVCRDLCDVSIDSFLRDDESWGGYRQKVTAWDASLLVVPSEEFGAIRRLSNSPHWKVMGIDGDRTIFGLQSVAENLPQLNLALRSILYLEWPTISSELDISNTIAVGSEQHARTVANVLCAIRLPFAAMRFIRNDSSPAAEKIRTRCYFELAHRVYRHSSKGSLLDQYRAMSRLRREVRNGEWSQEEVQNFASALPGIGLNPETIPEFQSVVADATELQDSRESQREGTQQIDSESFADLRQKFLRGDSILLLSEAGELDTNQRELMGCVLAAGELSAADAMRAFEESLSDLTSAKPELISEYKFYYGCLALEVGEVRILREALTESNNFMQNSPFTEIRDLYLQQVSR